MRRFCGRALALAIFALAILASFATQTAWAQAVEQQTARQALIEMFFSQAPKHLEKHLPEITQQALQKLQAGNGSSVLTAFSGFAQQAASGKEKLETFDTGSTLFTVKSVPGASFDELDVTVEQDSLSGDEDEIELGMHVIRAGKEESLPVIPRFTFTMKIDSGVWRLNEVGASVTVPLADPDFLKGLLDRQRTENEQMAIFSMRSVIVAETSYQAANNAFACSLSALGGKPTGALQRYLWDAQLVSGKKNGYVFAISNCDATHYQLAAEPASADAGERAFCADESGALRASSDGKATTCISNGTVVADTPKVGISEGTANASFSANNSTSPKSQAQRVRISQGAASGLLSSKVNPIYPAEARAAGISGSVVLKATISTTGDVISLELVSGHPMLAPSAIEAVKHWKYKPYLLNGKPAEVETQVTVNYTLSGR
ncbi:MAG: energy transducer TonB [Candidatus Sulfotelmatobacter sp.]|jgi:TonB family protein